MAKFDIDLIVNDAKFRKALDSAIQQAERVQDSLKKIKVPDTAIKNVEQVNNALKKTDKAANDAAGGLEKLSKSAKNGGASLTSMVKGFVVVGLLLELRKAVVNTASEMIKFENRMIGVRNMLEDNAFGTKEVNKGFEELKQQTKDLLKDFPITAEASATALYDIIGSGIDAGKAVEFLASASKLAVVGFTDVATATDGMTSVMNAWNKDASEADVVAAQFFETMKFGKITAEQLSRGIGLVASSAAAANVSLEETNAVIAAATVGGLKVNAAYSGLGALLANIAKPTRDAAAVSESLGIQFNYQALQAKGLTGFLKDLTEKSGGSEKIMTQLLGSVEGMRLAFALTSEKGAKVYAETLQAVMDKTGAVNKLNENTERQLSSLENQFTLMGNNIKDSITSVITPALDLLRDSLASINKDMKKNDNVKDLIKPYEDAVENFRFLEESNRGVLANIFTTPETVVEAQKTLAELRLEISRNGTETEKFKELQLQLQKQTTNYNNTLRTQKAEYEELTKAQELYNGKIQDTQIELNKAKAAEKARQAQSLKQKNATSDYSLDRQGTITFNGLDESVEIAREANTKILEIRKFFSSQGVNVSKEAQEDMLKIATKAAESITKVEDKKIKEWEKGEAERVKLYQAFIKEGLKFEQNKVVAILAEEALLYEGIDELLNKDVISHEEAAQRKVLIAEDRVKKVKDTEDKMYLDSTNSFRDNVNKQTALAKAAANNIVRGFLTLDFSQMTEGFEKLGENWKGALNGVADLIADFSQGFEDAYNNIKGVKKLKEELATLEASGPKGGKVESLKAEEEMLRSERQKAIDAARKQLIEAENIRIERTAYTTEQMLEIARDEKKLKIEQAQQALQQAEGLSTEREDLLKKAQEDELADLEEHNKKVTDLKQKILDEEAKTQDDIYKSVSKAGANAIGDFFGEWLGEGFGNLISSLIGPAFDKEMSKEDVEKTSKIWVKAIVDMVTTLAKNIVPLVKGIISGVIEGLKEIFSDPAILEDLLKSMYLFYVVVFDFIKDIFNWGSEHGIDVAISEFFNDMFTGIGDFFGGLWTAVQTAFNALFSPEIWSGIFGGLLTAFQTFGTNIGNAVIGIVEKLANFASELWNGVVKAFDSVISWVGNLGITLWNGMVDGINSFTSRFSDWINSLGGLIPGGGGGGDGKKWYELSTGGMVKLATGAMVSGAGNRDTVPAMLSPGELVVDRTTGPRLMNFIDNQDKQPESQDNELLLAILTDIKQELMKPMSVQTSIQVGQDALADVILQLNRNNRRLA